VRLSIPSSALVAAVVGFGSTLALIIAAAGALGATQEQTASWVTAVCLATAIETAWLSWRTKMPTMAAWSTPALALLGSAQGYSMNDAVGAFIMAAVMLVGTGLAKPLMRLVARLPVAIASAMLAGIVFTFAAGAARAAVDDPWLVLPLAILFFVARAFNPSLSALAVLLGGVAYAWALGRVPQFPAPELSTLVFTQPNFSFGIFVSLALPIYLVTMALQNLAGIAVLKASGYDDPPAGQLITVTGLISLLSAPFNASTTNLAAISAVICTGPDTHPDKAERWKTGPFYALCYVVFAIFGASLVALLGVLPGTLILLVAGLGLLGPLANALSIAFVDTSTRIAATVTFAVTASGITAFGIGAAFWGLAAGLAVLGLELPRKMFARQ